MGIDPCHVGGGTDIDLLSLPKPSGHPRTRPPGGLNAGTAPLGFGVFSDMPAGGLTQVALSRAILANVVIGDVRMDREKQHRRMLRRQLDTNDCIRSSRSAPTPSALDHRRHGSRRRRSPSGNLGTHLRVARLSSPAAD